MNPNIYYYAFDIIPWSGKLALFLEFWVEEPDGTRSYWGGQGITSIAEGFRVIDIMKQRGIVKKMF